MLLSLPCWQARLQQVIVVVSAFQGLHSATARLTSYLPGTTLVANPLTTAVFDATLLLGRVAAYMTCFAFNRQLATNYDFATLVLSPEQATYLNAVASTRRVDEAYLHMYRPFDVPADKEVRALIDVSQAGVPVVEVVTMRYVERWKHSLL
jgi:hypothetical protein